MYKLWIQVERVDDENLPDDSVTEPCCLCESEDEGVVLKIYDTLEEILGCG